MALRVIFMGSPPAAVPTLEALAASHEVVAVVTQPDRPRGRGQGLAAPEVKLAAARLGLEVLQPEKIRPPEFAAELERRRPDVCVVVAYGRILPPHLISLAPMGAINVHFSLLPKYRGAAPVQWAIIRGERETGVTIMQMDAGLDTGPMLMTRALPIADDDTAGSIEDKLSHIGAKACIEALAGLARGAIAATPQDASQASLAPMLEKAHGKVDFTRPAREVHCLVRGVDPWPGAFALLGDEPLKLYAPRLVSGSAAPGTVLGADRDGLIVACGDLALGFLELQLPGRKRMSAKALLAGRKIPPGTVLG